MSDIFISILSNLKVIFGFFFFINLFKFINFLSVPKNDIPQKLRNRSIVTEYEPPEGLSPIEAGTIINRSVDDNDISSVIVDLSLRGYVKIDLNDGVNFIKLKNGDDLVNPADKEIFKLLFQYRDKVSLDTLKNQSEVFLKTVIRITSLTEEYLLKNGYIYNFATSKFKKFDTPIIITIAISVVLMFFSFFFILFTIVSMSDFLTHYMAVVIFILSFAIAVLLGYIYRKMTIVLTDKGIEAYVKIVGFKNFLEIAEKDRIKFFNDPKVKPETLDRFLPYAIVLHVDNKWSKVFKDLYKIDKNEE